MFKRLLLLFAFLSFSGLSSTIATAQTAPTTPEAAQVAEQSLQTISEPHETVFGDWIFKGMFAQQSFIGFNPNYLIAVGDKIQVRLWGGYEFAGGLIVDAQGNVFLPGVGPVKVAGVRNEKLNEVIAGAIKEVYRKNVNIYASLEGAEPVKVFVTGFVRQPGLYAGHASDSVLYFLDKAGGIDPTRGSFLRVDVLRGGSVVRTINLYDFILSGTMPAMQIHDGDTVVVNAVQGQAGVFGEVQNPALFEFKGESIPIEKLLAYARPFPQATHVRINRNNMERAEVQYFALSDVAERSINPGDVLDVVSDKNPGTISIRVEGEHFSSKEFILPYGATLGDVLKQVKYGSDAEMDAIQLMRKSVQKRQKEMLEAQLVALQSSVLTARSNTVEEASLRTQEANLILQWVERARKIEPKGQVAIAGSSVRDQILLESGDIIRIPRKSELILVHGDVLFPTAIAWRDNFTAADYIDQAGGFTQKESASNVLLLHRDGTFVKLDRGSLNSKRIGLKPGDEIFVLPRVATKHVQIAKDIIEVLYQLALSAGVVFGI
ncbi:polysaccharide biosynthesis/export family protein [Pseudokordiimonas caeni]|uniref:polysaccharide biosynthesis/export family protein n=1 Tax=Pseudokordiimonas caeni TaxID=2997908 RepID=UPI00281128BD|nr:polysaccharide biosynthesis/export family protein [Pseudokordiimonas caeni]